MVWGADDTAVQVGRYLLEVVVVLKWTGASLNKIVAHCSSVQVDIYVFADCGTVVHE